MVWKHVYLWSRFFFQKKYRQMIQCASNESGFLLFSCAFIELCFIRIFMFEYEIRDLFGFWKEMFEMLSRCVRALLAWPTFQVGKKIQQMQVTFPP